MIVTGFEKKEKSTVEFTVTADAKEFEAAISKAYQKNKKNIAIPGFRKGKAPRMVVEGMYGPEVFHEDAVEELAPEAFELGAKENELKVVGRPGVKEFKVGDDKGVTMVFSAAVYPEVTLGEYKGLEAVRVEPEIADEDVDREIERMRERNSRMVPVERPAENGDTVNIDFEGKLEGVPFDGGTAQGHELELGSGSFVPGFEEQVVGMQTGETKDIDITFPEDYHEGLAGKAVVFTVKVNGVTFRELPELDDEFAKDVSEFDTLAEYRDSVRAELLKERTESADNSFKNGLIAKAIENMECELPDAMVEERVDAMMEDYSRNLEQNGYSLDQYLAMTGMNRDSFRMYSRIQATQNVKSDVLLAKVAEAEALEISDEELDAEYAKMAEQYGMEAEMLKNAVNADMLKDSLLAQKAAELIFASGVAIDPPPAEEEKPEAETETPDSAE